MKPETLHVISQKSPVRDRVLRTCSVNWARSICYALRGISAKCGLDAGNEKFSTHRVRINRNVYDYTYNFTCVF